MNRKLIALAGLALLGMPLSAQAHFVWIAVEKDSAASPGARLVQRAGRARQRRPARQDRRHQGLEPHRRRQADRR